MISLDTLRAELEINFDERDSEIRFLRGLIQHQKSLKNQRYIRRSIALLAYAHTEGFAKFALTSYLDHVNSINLTLGDAHDCIVALCLDREFSDLRDTQKKRTPIKHPNPDDNRLQRAWREIEFASAIPKNMGSQVAIDTDRVVDTKSNLKPHILRELLYRVGLNPLSVKEIEGDLHKLVGIRNDIAHGCTRRVVDTDDKLDALINLFRGVSHAVRNQIFDAVKERSFDRRP